MNPHNYTTLLSAVGLATKFIHGKLSATGDNVLRSSCKYKPMWIMQREYLPGRIVHQGTHKFSTINS